MVFAVGGFCEFTVRSGVILIKKTKFLGPLYCILAAVIWGLSFVAQSAGGEKTGTFTFNGLRTLLGAIVLVPLVIVSFKKENSALPDGEKKKISVQGRAYRRRLLRPAPLYRHKFAAVCF